MTPPVDTKPPYSSTIVACGHPSVPTLSLVLEEQPTGGDHRRSKSSPLLTSPMFRRSLKSTTSISGWNNHGSADCSLFLSALFLDCSHLQRLNPNPNSYPQNQIWWNGGKRWDAVPILDMMGWLRTEKELPGEMQWNRRSEETKRKVTATGTLELSVTARRQWRRFPA